MQLIDLAIHPIKSCGSTHLAEAAVTPRGLAHDRRWMLIDEEGRFVTGRECPTLVLIQPSVSTAASGAVTLKLQAPGRADLVVQMPGPDATRLAVTLWKEAVEVCLVSSEADQWLTQFLGKPVRLVYQADHCHRAIDHAVGATAEDESNLADGYPLLAIGTASLDALNARLAEPVTMRRFRPNLVIETSAAFEEDSWERVTINGVVFRGVKACARCIFTTVDPVTGEMATDREPLRTLTKMRFSPERRGVLFGMNWIPELEPGMPAPIIRTGSVCHFG